MPQELDGKIAVVTGSSGIGLGAALKLADLGAEVTLCGNDVQHNATAETIAAGRRIRVERVDVGDDVEVARFAKALSARVTGVDVLVNAAAIQPYGTIETTTVSDWDLVLRTNLRSCFLMSHVLYPMMKTRNGASIIHLASVQGHANQRNVLAYATSKGAIHALTRAMAVDCARDNVRVNSISPGSIRTPLLEYAAKTMAQPGASVEDTLQIFGAAHPIGRVGTVEEVAELIAYLAGPRSSFSTGSDYAIDGGLRAQLGV
jgi:NAD(P)-dependent dehydrogenase (short-subunit alcohol dehydrogenase family)